MDKNFFSFIWNLFTEEVFTEFSNTKPQSRLEFERAFERKKKTIGSDDTEEITLSDLGELMEIFKSMCPYTLQQKIDEMGLKGSVRAYKSKLRFNPKCLEQLAFEGPVQEIVRTISNLLQTDEISGISTILLVGGFSDSPVLRREMKMNFPRKTILHPPEANMAVVKGAVIFGHKPQISGRRSDMTYGISTNVPFVEGHHKEAHKCMIDGEWKCTDIFQIMVKKNEEVIPGKSKFEEEFNPTSSESLTANIEIYQSTSPKPKYTNEEGCSFLGKVQVSVPPLSTVRQGTYRTVKVQFLFGHTELRVRAIDNAGGSEVQSSFNLLAKR